MVGMDPGEIQSHRAGHCRPLDGNVKAKRRVGRPTITSPGVEWFAQEIEKELRDDELVGMNGPKSQAYLLDRAFEYLQVLASVCNESVSRRDVVHGAAKVANFCRRIAEIERTDGDDMREDYRSE